MDPEGRLFFSHGIDCVRMLDTTPIGERESWFDDFPGDKPEFARFRGQAYALHGHYAGKNPECFSFAGANLMRKYGPEWQRIYAERDPSTTPELGPEHDRQLVRRRRCS